MKHLVFAIVIALAVWPACGICSAEPASNPNLQALDRIPEPVGGMNAIMEHVSYPRSAIKDGIEGRVLLSVIVDSAGQVKSVGILEGVRSDLNKAARKAIEKIKWTPAQKDGSPVEASVIVPIQFKLEKTIKK